MKEERAKITALRDPARGAVAKRGPLRSVQEAEFTLARSDLDELWGPEALERLARAYWRFLERRSLHLLRVIYGSETRSVVLGSRRLELLRFRAPDFERGADFGRVTWPIERGVLVAPEGRGRGYLQFEVRRLSTPDEDPAKVSVRAEVANFYPMLRGSGRMTRLGALFYRQTQARLHVWMTYGFLKSLRSLDLPELRPERRDAYR